MKKIDIEIDRDELFGSIGIYSARKSLDNILDTMMLHSGVHPQLVDIMKQIVLVRVQLNGSLFKLDLLQDYAERLEKELGINQDPLQPYCSDCGRGGG